MLPIGLRDLPRCALVLSRKVCFAESHEGFRKVPALRVDLCLSLPWKWGLARCTLYVVRTGLH
jgi:hypothetical protein